jgi:hypothetical protein
MIEKNMIEEHDREDDREEDDIDVILAAEVDIVQF